MAPSPKMSLSVFVLVGTFLVASSQSLNVNLTTRGDKFVNGNLTIECLVTAPPTASIDLSKDGVRLTEDDRVSIIQEVADNMSRFDILIDRLRLSDSGNYQCQAQGGTSRTSSSLTIIVRDELTNPANLSNSSSSSSSSSASSSSSSSSSSETTGSSRVSISFNNSTISTNALKLLEDRLAELRARFEL